MDEQLEEALSSFLKDPTEENETTLQTLLSHTPTPVRERAAAMTVQRLRDLSTENEELRQTPWPVGVVLEPTYTNGRGPHTALVAPLAGGQVMARRVPKALKGKLEVGSEVTLSAKGAILELIGPHTGRRISKISRLRRERYEAWVENAGQDEKTALRLGGLLRQKDSLDALKVGTWIRYNPDLHVATHVEPEPDTTQAQIRSALNDLPQHLSWKTLILTDVTRANTEALWDEILNDVRSGRDLNVALLLVGPPGVGKTLYGQTLAVELGREVGYNKVDWQELSITEVMDKYLGESEKKIALPFERARDNAAKGLYTVIFHDEADSLLAPRYLAPTLTPGRIVGAFLAQMSGFRKLSRTIYIGTTNEPDYIDPAALRAGRISTIIRMERPGRSEVYALFLVYLEQLRLPVQEPIEVLAERLTDYLFAPAIIEKKPLLTVEFTDHNEAVPRTALLSGALIEEVVEQTARRVRRRAAQGANGEVGFDDLRAQLDTYFAGAVLAMAPHNIGSYLGWDAKKCREVVAIAKPASESA